MAWFKEFFSRSKIKRKSKNGISSKDKNAIFVLSKSKSQPSQVLTLALTESLSTDSDSDSVQDNIGISSSSSDSGVWLSEEEEDYDHDPIITFESKSKSKTVQSEKVKSKFKSSTAATNLLNSVDEESQKALNRYEIQSNTELQEKSKGKRKFDASSAVKIEVKIPKYEKELKDADPAEESVTSTASLSSKDLSSKSSITENETEDVFQLSGSTNGTNNSYTDSLFAESDGEESEVPYRNTTPRVKPKESANTNTKVSDSKSTSNLRNKYRMSRDESHLISENGSDNDIFQLSGLSNGTNSTNSTAISYTDSLFAESDGEDNTATRRDTNTRIESDAPASSTKVDNKSTFDRRKEYKMKATSDSKDKTFHTSQRTNITTSTNISYTDSLFDEDRDDSDLVSTDSLLTEDSFFLTTNKSQYNFEQSQAELSFTDSVFAESDDGYSYDKSSSTKRQSSTSNLDTTRNSPSTDFTFEWKAFLKYLNDDLQSGKSNLSSVYDITPIMEDTEGEQKEEKENKMERLDELDQYEEDTPQDFVNQDILYLKRPPGMEFSSCCSTITDSAASNDKKRMSSTFLVPNQLDITKKTTSPPSTNFKENDGSVKPLPPMALPWRSQGFKEVGSSIIERKIVKARIVPEKISYQDSPTIDESSWNLTKESIPLRSSNRSVHTVPDLVVEAVSVPLEQGTMKVVQTTPRHLSNSQEQDIFKAYYTAYSDMRKKKGQQSSQLDEEQDEGWSLNEEDENTESSSTAFTQSDYSASTLTDSLKSEKSETFQYMIRRLQEEAVRRRLRTHLGKS